MYINYDHYRIFYYVARYGSFTAAAQFLLNNQPNITRTVKNLEKELGCTLFIRSNRGVKLTPEGEKLYAHIAVAMEHIAMGEEEILQEKGLQCGVVSIGTTEVALHCFLLPVLREFHRTYKGIRIRISNHTTTQAISTLRRGLVDLAVVTSPFELNENLKCAEVKQFREIALCGEESAHLTESPHSLRELTEYPIISLAPNTMTYEFYSRLFAKHGLNLSPDIEAATADQLLPLIKNGLGIGFVPEEMAAEALVRNQVFEIKLTEEIPRRSVCLLKNKEKPMSIAAKMLEKAITARHA